MSKNDNTRRFLEKSAATQIGRGQQARGRERNEGEEETEPLRLPAGRLSSDDAYWVQPRKGDGFPRRQKRSPARVSRRIFSLLRVPQNLSIKNPHSLLITQTGSLLPIVFSTGHVTPRKGIMVNSRVGPMRRPDNLTVERAQLSGPTRDKITPFRLR